MTIFSSERAQKTLKNDVLDVKKFDDTAENEPLQISKTERSEYTTHGQVLIADNSIGYHTMCDFVAGVETTDIEVCLAKKREKKKKKKKKEKKQEKKDIEVCKQTAVALNVDTFT